MKNDNINECRINHNNTQLDTECPTKMLHLPPPFDHRSNTAVLRQTLQFYWQWTHEQMVNGRLVEYMMSKTRMWSDQYSIHSSHRFCTLISHAKQSRPSSFAGSIEGLCSLSCPTSCYKYAHRAPRPHIHQLRNIPVIAHNAPVMESRRRRIGRPSAKSSIRRAKCT